MIFVRFSVFLFFFQFFFFTLFCDFVCEPEKEEVGDNSRGCFDKELVLCVVEKRVCLLKKNEFGEVSDG